MSPSSSFNFSYFPDMSFLSFYITTWNFCFTEAFHDLGNFVCFVLSMCMAIYFGHIFLSAYLFVFLMTSFAYSFFLQLYSSLLPSPFLPLPSSLSSSSTSFSSLDQVSSRLAVILLMKEDYIYMIWLF